ncbi:MAG: hypothetical protein ACRD50_10210 [Candidatus Acidiferrales bacterium]
MCAFLFLFAVVADPIPAWLRWVFRAVFAVLLLERLLRALRNLLAWVRGVLRRWLGIV